MATAHSMLAPTTLSELRYPVPVNPGFVDYTTPSTEHCPRSPSSMTTWLENVPPAPSVDAPPVPSVNVPPAPFVGIPPVPPDVAPVPAPVPPELLHCTSTSRHESPRPSPNSPSTFVHAGDRAAIHKRVTSRRMVLPMSVL